jgi:predicted CXXCH cytochrome family protein
LYWKSHGGIFAFIILIAFLSGCVTKPAEVPTTILEATFVGSEKCAECHDRIYNGWRETLHAKMTQDVRENPLAILGDFETPSEVRTFTKDDVVITIGNQWKQRYMTKIGDDYYILPAQYNLEDGTWTPYHPKDWRERPWFVKCGGCHATGVDPVAKTVAEWGIGCEACHGPGSNHVEAAEKGSRHAYSTIVNPGTIPTDAATQICGSCHNRGHDPSGKYSWPVDYRATPSANLRLYYVSVTPEENTPKSFWPSGESKQHHQQFLDWQRSEHAKVGVTCFTCHTVHSTGNKFQTKMPGDQLCKSCHTAISPKAAHSIHTFGSCIGCHMPRTVKSAYAGDERSHTFRFLSPELSLEAAPGASPREAFKKQPNSCTGCHHHEDTPLENLMGALAEVRMRDMPLFEAVKMEGEAK